MNKKQQEKQAEQVDALFTHVYSPAFLNKCAELGLPLATEEELERALKIAVELRQHHSQKKASVLDNALQALQSLHAPSEQKEAKSTSGDKVVEAAVQNPEVQKALLGAN